MPMTFMISTIFAPELSSQMSRLPLVRPFVIRAGTPNINDCTNEFKKFFKNETNGIGGKIRFLLNQLSHNSFDDNECLGLAATYRKPRFPTRVASTFLITIFIQ